MRFFEQLLRSAEFARVDLSLSPGESVAFFTSLPSYHPPGCRFGGMCPLRIGTYLVFIGLRIYDKNGERRASLADRLCYACD